MSENNVLILQCDVVLKNYEINKLYDTILEQKKQGVILLPSYVKVVNVPEEVTNGELVVMNSGAPEPKSKWYLIKSPGGQYLKASRQDSGICEFTDYRYYAKPFDKNTAEQIITENFGKGYMMEEL